MAEKIYQVRDVGIYHGLPVYSQDVTGLTAIVTGANGISGYYMVRALSQAPQRWKRIICLSRRPPALELPSNAEFISLDFLKSPEEIAAVLKEKNVQADYVFFFSYVQVEPKAGKFFMWKRDQLLGREKLWSNAEEMARVNALLLSNFLEALPQANIKPKRIMLQTGAKNYGLHLGSTALPQEESDSRVTLEPNFYYPQEDFLWNYCKQHGIEWNVCMPSFILGAVPDAAMNVCFPLAVYAAVTKHLGEKLEYPGDLRSWESPQVQSSSIMNAYLEEWAVLTPEARNEKFNAFDDSAFCWGKFWPKYAKLYGLEYTRPDPEKDEYKEIPSKYDTPPRGFGKNSPIRYKFTLVEWAHRKDVQEAWKELAAKYDLLDKEFRDIERIFSFTDAALSWSQSIYFSADKARSLGWHGHVDSTQSIFEVFREFEKIKMVPPVPQ